MVRGAYAQTAVRGSFRKSEASELGSFSAGGRARCHRLSALRSDGLTPGADGCLNSAGALQHLALRLADAVAHDWQRSFRR